jgi:hypothetical protein
MVFGVGAGDPQLQVSQMSQGPPVLFVLHFWGLETSQQQTLFSETEEMFNGLITNDKFCMTRTGRLRLSHWRRPLRLRTPAAEQWVYSTSEKSECGGSHETPVESPSGGDGVPGRTEPLGSGLSVNSGDSSLHRSEPNANQLGGATCE